MVKNTKGMTLVEVVVATILVGMTIVALVSILEQSSVFSKRIDLSYASSLLAQRRIDLIKRLEFDQIPGAAETAIRIDIDGNMNSAGDYERTTEVTENYDSNAYLTEVVVTVKKIGIGLDGNKTTIGHPTVMETLFANIN